VAAQSQITIDNAGVSARSERQAPVPRSEEGFDAEDYVPIPGLFRVPETAEMSVTSHSRVLQLVDALEGAEIGHTLVLPRSSAERRHRSMAKVGGSA
jgi:hypothetical protein